MNEDIAPYTCLRCYNKVGLSWIEKKHDCKRPLFDKNGAITDRYKEIYGSRFKEIYGSRGEV